MESAMFAQELMIMRKIALNGSQRAAAALGQFSGDALTVTDATVSVTTVDAIPYRYGDPEEAVVGVFFIISGDIDGYLLAFFWLHDAATLVSGLLGAAPETLLEFGEMELSVLGEAGNLIVSSYLISIESLCGFDVIPSPPTVAVEMYGAMLTSAVLPVAETSGDVLLIEAEIQPSNANSRVAACRVLLLPTPDSWARLRHAFREDQSCQSPVAGTPVESV